jgi:hypothetical protein
MAFTVNGSGDLSGTVVNSGLSENGSLTGHIATDNKLTGAIHYPDHDVTLDGTVDVGSGIKGKILLMTEKYGRTVYVNVCTLDCARQ